MTALSHLSGHEAALVLTKLLAGHPEDGVPGSSRRSAIPAQ
ncbi:hypothetical protein [Nonomuraea monospora]